MSKHELHVDSLNDEVAEIERELLVLQREVSILQRENRELRGLVTHYENGIRDIIDKYKEKMAGHIDGGWRDV